MRRSLVHRAKEARIADRFANGCFDCGQPAAIRIMSLLAGRKLEIAFCRQCAERAVFLPRVLDLIAPVLPPFLQRAARRDEEAGKQWSKASNGAVNETAN